MAVKRPVAVVAGALLAVGLLGIIDWRTGPLFSITIFYVIPVGFVAWFAGRNAGLAFSALCILIWLVADFNTLGTRVPVGIDIWNGVVSLLLLLLISYTLAATKAGLDLEATTVKAVQDSLLPAHVPSIAGLDIGAKYRPAGNLSGDYYDFIVLPGNRLIVCIGDVSGKGAGAALLMANLQGSVRAMVHCEHDLAVACRRLNGLVAQGLSGFYVTFVMVAIDRPAGKLSYVNAGHNPPLLFRRNGDHEQFEATGVPLGVFPHSEYSMRAIDLQEGDRLVLYTDGITEARDAVDEEFGVERLIRLVGSLDSDSADALAARTMAGLHEFEVGAAMDDATLVMVRIAGAAA